MKDFEGLGSRLRQAHEHYDDALSKLHTGKGNVIRQAEMLRALGVKPSRTLPAPLVELALDTPTPELPAGSEPPSL